jgi:hypothetical protein
MKPIEIKTISKQLFDAYVFSSRHLNVAYFAEEARLYANSNESILGVIALDKTDNDFAAIIFGRDENGKFCAFNLETLFIKIEDAAHHFLRRDGNIESWMPEFYLYASITSHIKII